MRKFFRNTVSGVTEMIAIDLTRAALRKFWGHGPDWAPDWNELAVDRDAVRPVPGVGKNDTTQAFETRVIRTRGEILEARAKLGFSKVDLTFYLEHYRGLIRGWQARQINLLINADTEYEHHHMILVRYVSVEETLGYVTSYRTPILSSAPGQDFLPWVEIFERQSLSPQPEAKP